MPIDIGLGAIFYATLSVCRARFLVRKFYFPVEFCTTFLNKKDLIQTSANQSIAAHPVKGGVDITRLADWQTHLQPNAYGQVTQHTTQTDIP